MLPDGDAHCFDATATVGVITFLMWQVGGGAWKLLGVITFLIWQVGGGAWVLLGVLLVLHGCAAASYAALGWEAAF